MIVEDPLARARRLDRADELAHLVDAFHPIAEGPGYRTIYLAGHSLGLQPRTAERLVERELRRWREDGVVGWPQRWLDLSRHAASRLEAILGAASGSIRVGDSTTIMVHQAAGAVLAARPDRPDIVTSEGEFPTDLYALEQRARAAGGRLRLLPAAPEADRVARELDDRVGLVALGHVDFRTGRLLDLADITETAHRAGAWVLWDCSHSAGAVPLSLHASGAELAVGCTYKHLCGGPGSPGWIMARPDLVDQLDPPLRGWFGHDAPFDLDRRWTPASGVERFAIGTPPVLSLVAALAGLDLVAAVDPAALAAKTAALTQLAIDLSRDSLAPLGFDVLTPRTPERRGATVALRHDDAWPITQLATQRLGILCDFREPDVIRLGLSPLPLRHVDVVAAVNRLRDAVSTNAHAGFSTERGRIT
ncbi:MAG: aminotransferase class V-fold PLP-dependent enzyme [Actinomycetota bacterium]